MAAKKNGGNKKKPSSSEEGGGLAEKHQAATKLQALARGYSTRNLIQPQLLKVQQQNGAANYEQSKLDAYSLWREERIACQQPGYAARVLDGKQKPPQPPASLTKGMSDLNVLRSGSPRKLAERFPGGPADADVVSAVMQKHDIAAAQAKLAAIGAEKQRPISPPREKPAARPAYDPRESREHRRLLSRATPPSDGSTSSRGSTTSDEQDVSREEATGGGELSFSQQGIADSRRGDGAEEEEATTASAALLSA